MERFNKQPWQKVFVAGDKIIDAEDKHQESLFHTRSLNFTQRAHLEKSVRSYSDQIFFYKHFFMSSQITI